MWRKNGAVMQMVLFLEVPWIFFLMASCMTHIVIYVVIVVLFHDVSDIH